MNRCLTLFTPGGGGDRFFAITKKLELRSSNFLTFAHFLTHAHHLSWAFIPTALFYVYQTKYFLDFNMLQHFGKPITKASRLHNVGKEICTDFCTFKGNLHIFQFFLNSHLSFKNFAKVFEHLNLRSPGLFKSVQFVAICNFLHIFCLITRLCSKYLNFCKCATFFQKRIKCYRFVSQ